MAHWAKLLAAQLDNLSLITRTHTVEERTTSHKLPSGLHKHAVVCGQSSVCTHAQNQ